MATGSVNFGVVVQQTDPHTLGVGSSTYGANPLSSDAQRDAERNLDARFIRVPVGFRNNRVTTSAAGTDGSLDMPALVNLYRSWGYRVIAVCGGRTNDRDIQPGDATRIAQALGFDNIDYTPPNEPDNMGNWTVENVGGGQYSVTRTAMMVHDELRALNPNVKIWGPVWVDERRGETQRYIDIMGNRLAGVDFHRYGAGMGAGPNQKSTESYFTETRDKFGTMIANCRQDLRARGLDAPYGNVNLDEINFRWIFENDPRFFQAVNTVWMTSALGHVLVNGGRVMPYATQNGALGVMVERWNNDQGRPASSPMPAYWAIAAFTGGRIWSHYKDAFVQAETDDRNVEVFAVNNEAGGYNLVIVNKKENQNSTLTLSLNGIAPGNHTVYQSVKDAPYDQPRRIVEAQPYTNSLNLQLPACTITVVVLDPEGAVEPEPLPEPKKEWTIDVGASKPASGWAAAGSLVAGGTDGTNRGTTQDTGDIPEKVFDSERWGPQVWTIPVKQGDYTVSLLFSERFAGAQSVGGRVFNIDVNGEKVNDFDVWVAQGEAAGKFARLDIAVRKTDKIVVTLAAGASGANPFINGITVTPLVEKPTEPEGPGGVDITEIVAANAVAQEAAKAASTTFTSALSAAEDALAAATAAFAAVGVASAELTAAMQGLQAAIDEAEKA